MSAFVIHQTLTRPQKIDSREGWFWCKKGLVCESSKMNFYLKARHLHSFWGDFQQNEVRFGAKRSAICC